MNVSIDRAASTVTKRPVFDELSMVSLMADVDQEGVRLPAGSRGAVVFVYDDAVAFEVEFVEPLAAVLTLRAEQLTQ